MDKLNIQRSIAFSYGVSWYNVIVFYVDGDTICRFLSPGILWESVVTKSCSPTCVSLAQKWYKPNDQGRLLLKSVRKSNGLNIRASIGLVRNLSACSCSISHVIYHLNNGKLIGEFLLIGAWVSFWYHCTWLYNTCRDLWHEDDNWHLESIPTYYTKCYPFVICCPSS